MTDILAELRAIMTDEVNRRRAKYERANRKSALCDTVDGALEYGRHQGLEIAALLLSEPRAMMVVQRIQAENAELQKANAAYVDANTELLRPRSTGDDTSAQIAMDLRDNLLRSFAETARYWAELPDSDKATGRVLSVADRCDGVVFSILTILDGCAGSSEAAFDLVANVAEDDERQELDGVVISDMLHEHYGILKRRDADATAKHSIHPEIISAFAEAWASIDGKLERYRACEADPELDGTEGRYEGYREDTKELLVRAAKRNQKVAEMLGL